MNWPRPVESRDRLILPVVPSRLKAVDPIAVTIPAGDNADIFSMEDYEQIGRELVKYLTSSAPGSVYMGVIKALRQLSPELFA